MDAFLTSEEARYVLELRKVTDHQCKYARP